MTGFGGEALSKRLGTLALKDLRDAGIEPPALCSLMARLGSSQPVELRLSLDEIAEEFDLSTFGSAPTKFDEKDSILNPSLSSNLATERCAIKPDSIGVPKTLAQSFGI